MLFKYLLEKVNAKTEEDILKWSVIYGWGLVAVPFMSIIMLGVLLSLPEAMQPQFFMKLIVYACIAAFILFIFRYTSAKPILGASAAGITTVTLATILDSWSGNRNSSFTVGAIVGVILVLGVLLLKNLVISWYYLISETIRFVRHRRSQTELDITTL